MCEIINIASLGKPDSNEVMALWKTKLNQTQSKSFSTDIQMNTLQRQDLIFKVILFLAIHTHTCAPLSILHKMTTFMNTVHYTDIFFHDMKK